MHICQIFFHQMTKEAFTVAGSLSGSRKPILRDPVPDEIFQKLRNA
jgi:hypothetical protein